MDNLIKKAYIKYFVSIIFALVLSVSVSIITSSWINLVIGILVIACLGFLLLDFHYSVKENMLVCVCAECVDSQKKTLFSVNRKGVKRAYRFEVKKYYDSGFFVEDRNNKHYFSLIMDKSEFYVGEKYIFLFKKSQNGEIDLYQTGLINYETYNKNFILNKESEKMSTIENDDMNVFENLQENNEESDVSVNKTNTIKVDFQNKTIE